MGSITRRSFLSVQLHMLFMSFFNLFLNSLSFVFYLFLEKVEEREVEREGNIDLKDKH